MSDTPSQAPGWYYAQGDPPGTQRYWDGSSWQGGPQPVAGAGGVGMAGVQLADGGKRIGAWFVDALVLLIPVVIIGLVVGGTDNSDPFATGGRQILSGVITTAIWFAYHVFTNANGGQSVGRKVLGIKIVKTDGSEAQMDTLLKRFALGFIGIIPFIGLVMWLIGLASLVMIFVDENNQAIWDKVAGTKTVTA